jgi:hypothetical protein
MLPTAVQAVVVGHETPAIEPDRPLRAGVDWINQLVPFQRSASVPMPVAAPTAVQAVLDGHETPLRRLSAPVAFGVLCTDQLVPFQRTANVTMAPARLRVPTAVQNAAPHDTA